VAKNKYVDFVPDAHFEKCVKHVCNAFEKISIPANDKELQKEGIDPIKMTFDMIQHKMNFAKWKKKEKTRQDDKTVNNAIGEFHQLLLGGVENWTDLGIGDETHVDLKRNDNLYHLELKNKENTVNSDSKKQVRNKLEKLAKEFPKATCYWAYVVPKNGKSEEKEWEYKNGNNKLKVRRITGEKIYELITGDKNNLKSVWKALPSAIKNVCNCEFTISAKDNTIFEEWFVKAFTKPKKSKKKPKVKKDN
jgi:hypothetical protein